MAQIANRWYVRNHVISNILIKTMLFSLNTCTVTFLLTISNLLPPGRGKRSYLIPRTNFQLPYLPSQAHKDPSIYPQLKSGHIHSIHQQSRDFIHGNFAYLPVFVAVWSDRGHARKKVTAVSFFRCHTMCVTVATGSKWLVRRVWHDPCCLWESWTYLSTMQSVFYSMNCHKLALAYIFRVIIYLWHGVSKMQLV